jgi:hypothetical protein
MIPVDEQVAANQGKRGWEMPAKELYQRLIEKTRGRLIRVDQGIIIQTQPDQIPLGAQLTDEQLEDFSSKVSESEIKITTDAGEVRPLYYEYRIY